MLTPKETGLAEKFWPMDIPYSALLNGTDAFGLSTPAITDFKKFTINFSTKLCVTSNSNIMVAQPNANNWSRLILGADNHVGFEHFVNGNLIYYRQTSTSVTDTTAHYNIHFVFDSTQAIDEDRIQIWINGVKQTLTGGMPPLNDWSWFLNASSWTTIGEFPLQTTTRLRGYLSQFYFIDGNAVPPTEFGRHSNIVDSLWTPTAYTGTYGLAGFKLDFADAATMGKDVSGNGNDLSLVGTPEQTTDTPTNNLCTLNPLNSELGMGYSNGNKTSISSVGYYATGLGNIGLTRGKWYWEYKANTTAIANLVGVATPYLKMTFWCGFDNYGWGYNRDGRCLHNGATIATYDAWELNDIIRVALDVDAGTLQFYKNEVLQLPIITGLSGMLFPAHSNAARSGGCNLTVKFTNSEFVFSPPAGFLSLDPVNLRDEPVILSGTYTGRTLNDNTGGPYVFTNCALSTVTIGANVYTNDGSDNSVILFTSNGFKLISSTDNSNEAVYNWTGTLKYPAITSNAQTN